MSENQNDSSFSFASPANVSGTSKKVSMVQSANNTPSKGYLDSSYDHIDNSKSGLSFHTAHTDSLGSNHFNQSGTPSRLGPLMTSSPRNTPEKAAPLTVQTSTPNKDVENISDSSRGDFSFLNTSGAQPDGLNIPKAGSFPFPPTPPTKPPPNVPKSSPHSRNSSISWSVEIPEEWTMERVQIWLELYQFNNSWINTFKKYNLVGDRFLKLTNYQNLKKYKDELNSANDSTQSRFIHLLRKTLDKPSSITTLSAGSPHSPNSSISSMGSMNSSPDISNELKTRIRSSSENALTATVSTPSFNSHKLETGTEVKGISAVVHQRNPKSKPQRPVSTIESSSKNGWPSSPASPASLSSTYGIFRRQHKKSSSSESSLFTSLFSSSTPHLPQTSEDKRQSISSRESDSRSLLSKFRKKERTKSKDSRNSIVSPISPNTSNLEKKTYPPSVEVPSKTIPMIIPLPTAKINNNKLPFSIDRKYQPISQSKNSDKYILVTTDNLFYRPLNIGQITSVADFKKMLKDTLMPDSSGLNIYLTDFDSLIAEPLEDSIIDEIVKHKFNIASGKFLIRATDQFTPRNASVGNSISDAQSIDSREGKFYPNTPQYYYENTIKSSADVDYLNFKEYIDTAASEVPLESAHPDDASISRSLTQSSHNSSTDTPTSASSSRPSLSRKKPQSSSKNIPSTFRVIRPTEKGEINFDKRRESPYSRPSLVAKRSAPPPPKRPSERPTISTSLTPTPISTTMESRNSVRKQWLEPVKESISNEGTYIAPYIPSSSNTLIPEPYKGGTSSVSPISRKALEYDFHDTANSIINDDTPRTMLNSSKTQLKKTQSLNNKFKENIISFDNAPQLENESEEEEDSDEDFWAKAPSDNKSNSSTMSEMIVRPAPEVLYDNLEKFFPDADLDRPVIDVSTPPTSPLNNKTKPEEDIQKVTEPPKLKRVVSSSNRDMDNLRRPQRMKTIRAVAKEASEARKREYSKRNILTQPQPLLVRRQSTKMWGRKVVEVKPNQRQFISKLRKDKNDEISEFSWIKGELIGKGTFGNVYIALNVTTGEMIAVKQVQLPRIKQTNSRVADVIDALTSEVDTLKDLDHLNIVQYLGFEETEREYNLFLEYVAGGSVASCLRLHGRFDEPLIKFLTSQVLEGLSYLHSKGILHRDMKADNLLLDLDGVCKISDFGISKKSNDIYANNTGMSMQGTIFWMAPEVVDSREGYSAKVDIWSLGCIVLEMFAGRRPWSNLEAIPAMLKIGKAKAAPPIPEDTLPYVSMEGRAFLDSCFTTNAQERPTAGVLSKDIFCEVDPNFSFAKTRLANLIKSNEKRVII